MLTALLTVAALATSVHTASIPAPNGTIDGCYSDITHALVVIDSNSSCGPLQTPLHWNQTGPQGPAGPQGPQGVPGPTGATGPPGPAGTGSSTFISYTSPQYTSDSGSDTDPGETLTCPAGSVPDRTFIEVKTTNTINGNDLLADDFPFNQLVDGGDLNGPGGYGLNGSSAWGYNGDGSVTVNPPGNIASVDLSSIGNQVLLYNSEGYTYINGVTYTVTYYVECVPATNIPSP